MEAVFQDVFDSWDAAVAYQRIALQYYLDANTPIRACEIVYNRDFLTGKDVFKVFVRPFVVLKNAAS